MSRHLRRWARENPEKLAVVCGGSRLTYSQLEDNANRFAHLFRARGLQRGDHIALLLANRPDALAIVWGAYRCGLYVTPLATTLAVREAAYMVDNCNAKLVLADAAYSSLALPLPEMATRCIHWISMGGYMRGFERTEPLLESASAQPVEHEPPGALMMYTSGTTGAPKGVWRPLPPADYDGTPPFAADVLALFGLDRPHVRYLSTAPLYHSAPLRFALAVSAGGGTVFLMDRFDATHALELLEREAITHSQWVPTMFQRMLALPESQRRAFRAPQHRSAVHGAAPCHPALKQAMIEWWGPILLEYYSGSEGVGLTLIDSQEALRKPGSVGRPRKGAIHVLGDDHCELPAGENGVVYFSSVTPFAYYNDPAKTAAKTSPQGWQTFGDIGQLDADGYLFLTDRQDDVIISGGVNLYPQEIERAILEVPGVDDCAVVGVADERFGERAVAFIVPASERARDVPSLIAEIQRHNGKHLGRLKQPSEIRPIDALPRSPAGKLLRRALRELVNSAQEPTA
jgi:fatty-acyl-CoA synthase